MSPGIDDTTFWSTLKQFTISKNGHLKELYSKFEDMCALDDNKNYCLIEKDKYNTCDNVHKLYHNLYGNKVKYEDSNPDFATFYDNPKKFCFFLKYWLYDKIIFNKFDGNAITQVFNGLESGNKIEIFMGNNYTCSFDIFEVEKIKEIKLFYDYIGSYDTEQKKSSINDKICEGKYKTTLNSMIDLYNDRSRNSERNSNKYSNKFDECKRTYNINVLCKLQCVGDGPHSMDEAQTGCSEVDSSPQHSSRSDTSHGKLHEDSTFGDSENQSTGITITIIPILAALFIIFPILYKLTPLGSWIHNSVIKAKNFLRNSNVNSTDALLNHISESDNEIFLRTPHYISYQSS
ncbi:PIR Superfamily Protein [Plasmodium ovale wallikeri]|uniref:PIR Superfamily Protein n=2 Tax=Plasmodium ovale TaxID=36330 RepID=A0A1A9A8C9_PLAOA|nr:PIR Superfamily Protein [Plasmodium ovale wallikeri]SBT59265.1 PIR Superfamily Protein [Plasmodium ovale wallikeri]SBT74058.1 Plasmodium vivax Vir protein, putative [Plasmodium ovale]